MIKKLLTLTFVCTLLAGCKQDDITPSWIKIDQFTLTTDEPTQGSNSHNITDAWIYIDSKPIGVFELPCHVPVLEEGEHELLIFPGIKNNGISDTRVRYPFYTPYETIINLTLDDTLAVNPATQYKNSLTFAYIEDFEGAGISFAKGPTSDTNMVFVTKTEFPDIVKYGEKCGGIFTNNIDSIYTGSTLESLVLPKVSEVYLEIDYRNNNSLAMGTIARYPDGSTFERTPYIVMNPQETGEEVWKKIYIDLKEDVSVDVNVSSFEIFFIAVLDAANVTGNVYVDNIKVVHFQ